MRSSERAPASSSVRPSDVAPVDASAFRVLGLSPQLLRALGDEGHETPTPIQVQAIPHVLEGRDLVGCAQTGTGKTAAFVLPLLQRLEGGPTGRIRALILTPTRELAAQIGERTAGYGRHSSLRHAVIYGGVSQRKQERDLARDPEVLIATPGRLIDFMGQGLIRLGAVEVLVLDEADTMLDMGFIHAVRRIVAAVPKQRQTLLFSATMPPAIAKLSQSILIDPVKVAVAPAATPVEAVSQSIYFVAKNDKRALLEHLLTTIEYDRTLVFTRTKHGANRVAEQLCRAGIDSLAIHGNKSQNARERALERFRTGETRVLIATDIAARGIDVPGVSHVVNFDLPDVPESYVHRIGRTGRAGASGDAIAFCDREERGLLADIERLIGKRIPVASGSDQPTQAGPVVEQRRERPEGDAPRRDARPGGPRRDDGRPRGGDPRRGDSRDAPGRDAGPRREQGRGRDPQARRDGPIVDRPRRPSSVA